MKTLLIFCALAPAVVSVADAQRLRDARTAVARQVSQPADTARPNHHESAALAAQRIFFGATIGAAIGVPLAYVALAGESSGMLYVAVGGYLLGTAVGASFVESDDCYSDKRFFRALGGSLLGGIVGGGIAGAINGRKDAAAVATALFAAFGAPVGAAIALAPCH